MTVYSELDLIGEYLETTKRTFFERVVRNFFSDDKVKEIEFTLSKVTYLRIITYSQVISRSADIEFGPGELIKVIIHHYIKNYFTYNNTKRYAELLKEDSGSSRGYSIIDHTANTKYFIENKVRDSKYKIKLSFDKEVLLKGEVLLAEIDEIHTVRSTLEEFTAVILTDYVNRSRKLSEAKIVREVKKILENVYG